MEKTKEKAPENGIASRAEYAAGHGDKLGDDSSYLRSDHSLVGELVLEIKNGLDPGSRVLEVGCGGGHTAATLFRMGFEVTATDFSETALSAARDNYKGIDFEQADATALTFSADAFDAVVAVELIEHLADPRSHVREVHRVLRERGTYFVKTPNRILHDIYYRHNEEVARWQPSVMSASELELLLTEAGFAVRFVRLRRLPLYQIKKATLKLGPVGRALEPLLRATPIGWLPSAAQPSLVCVAVKRSE